MNIGELCILVLIECFLIWYSGIFMVMIISYFFYGLILMVFFYNVVFRVDILRLIKGMVLEFYLYFIFDGFIIKLGLRIVKILKYLFLLWDVIVSKVVGNRVIIFVN